MELLPVLRIGWLNGWVPFGLLVLTEGALFLIFPREVVVGLGSAMLAFRNMPLNQPVTVGLYQVSRHPQVFVTFVSLLGAFPAIGSWPAVLMLVLSRGLQYLGILAEEEACLRQYGDSYRAYMEGVPRYSLFF